jgi:GNAT superfamily N-acetyltransferase
MEGAHVRRATAADIRALAQLRREFTFEDPHVGAVARDDFDEEFATLLADGIESGRWVVWVAEADGEIVSHAFVGVVEKIPRPIVGFHAIGCLTNVYTRPRFRSRGIGGRVLGAVTEWAREAEIELLVVWPSEESVAFYERHGFADRGEPLVWLHPEGGD